MMYWGSGKKRICGCCIRIRAGISVRIRVRDGVMISNRVRRRVKLVNYSLITALPIATSADPHIRFLPVADVLHLTNAFKLQKCKTDHLWSARQRENILLLPKLVISIPGMISQSPD